MNDIIRLLANLGGLLRVDPMRQIRCLYVNLCKPWRFAHGVVIKIGGDLLPYPGGTFGSVPEHDKDASYTTFCFSPTSLAITVLDYALLSLEYGVFGFVWTVFGGWKHL